MATPMTWQEENELLLNLANLQNPIPVALRGVWPARLDNRSRYVQEVLAVGHIPCSVEELRDRAQRASETLDERRRKDIEATLATEITI